MLKLQSLSIAGLSERSFKHVQFKFMEDAGVAVAPIVSKYPKSVGPKSLVAPVAKDMRQACVGSLLAKRGEGPPSLGV